jgi:hypothetical protein
MTRSMAPSATVVVPVFGHQAALHGLLEALGKQDVGGGFDVVIVDNAPVPVVQAPSGTSFPVRMLHEPLPGPYAARNAALAVARAEVLLFTDADCRPDPGWVGRMVQKVMEEPAAVHAGRVEVVATSASPGWGEQHDLAFGFPIEEYVARRQFGVTANLAVHRDVFAHVGPFDPGLLSCGDREWCRRASRRGHPVRFHADAVVQHPARTFPELRSKIRRVQGGLAVLAGSRVRHALVSTVKAVIPVAHPARIRQAMSERGKEALPRLVAVGYALRWVAVAESYRLLFGGTPRR